MDLVVFVEIEKFPPSSPQGDFSKNKKIPFRPDGGDFLNPGGKSPGISNLDEDLKIKLKAWVSKNAVGGTSGNMTVETFRNYANSLLLLEHTDDLQAASSTPPSIGITTARKWLLRLGFTVQKSGTGMFIDGHDRPDVVDARSRYLAESEVAYARGYNFFNQDEISTSLDEFQDTSFRRSFGQMGGQLKLGNTNPAIVYQHDEVVYNANCAQSQYWGDGSFSMRTKKSQGQGRMVSDFVFEGDRVYLRMTDEEFERYVSSLGEGASRLPQEARIYFDYGKNSEGYWNSELFLNQMTLAMDIHEIIFPGHQAIFKLDQSSGHRKFGADALVASAMSKKPGGKQPFLRNGIGQKGLQATLIERNVLTLEQAKKMKKAEMVGLMNAQGDFMSEKTLVEHLVEQRGHQIIWIPKFHCELNWIEMIWGQSKKHTRKVCAYTFPALKKAIPEALNRVTCEQARAFARKSRDYERGYQAGKQSGNVGAEIKIYKSHRRVFETTMVHLALSHPNLLFSPVLPPSSSSITPSSPSSPSSAPVSSSPSSSSSSSIFSTPQIHPRRRSLRLSQA